MEEDGLWRGVCLCVIELLHSRDVIYYIVFYRALSLSPSYSSFSLFKSNYSPKQERHRKAHQENLFVHVSLRNAPCSCPREYFQTYVAYIRRVFHPMITSRDCRYKSDFILSRCDVIRFEKKSSSSSNESRGEKICIEKIFSFFFNMENLLPPTFFTHTYYV